MPAILPLATPDYDAWYPLWQAYLIFYKASLSDEVTRTTFARLTSGAEPMGGFIARDAAGDAIGITHWIIHLSCWTIGDYCYLQDLFVAPGTRKQGVGRALIETVYAQANALGCARVHWLTQESNRTAMRLYDQMAERSGFVQVRKLLG